MGEVYAHLGTSPPAVSADDVPDTGDAAESSLGGDSSAQATTASVCLAHALEAVLQLLQVVAVLVGELGHCPPELLVALWTLRGYVYEKQGRMSLCFVDYLQALSTIDEAWGDPRKRGGRGHPFALMLAWKLGLISYCQGDVKSIDKFADYFRSLTLHYASSCPFTWGPPLWPEGLQDTAKGQAPPTSFEEQDIGRLLWSNEAFLWLGGHATTTPGTDGGMGGAGPGHGPGPWAGTATGPGVGGPSTLPPLRQWWLRHDILNFGAEGPGLPGSRPRSRVPSPASDAAGTTVSPSVPAPAAAATAAEEAEPPAPPGEEATRTGRGGAQGRPSQGGRQRELMSSEGGIASDMQEVRRGTIFAFGSNHLGQLGVGRPTTAAQAGSNHGSNPVLGAANRLASNASSGESSDLWWSGRPVRVMALKECRVKDIACGESHCVAIDLDGQLFAWGSDEWGQVGAAARRRQATAGSVDGDQASHIPVSIMPLDATLESCISGPPIHFQAVACGAQFSCALDRTGAVWTWGCGEGGVLGLGVGGLSGRPGPARVEALASSACSAIACGSYHATALVGGGKLHTWGRAEGGQLGLSEARIGGHIEEKALEDTCVCEPQRVVFAPGGGGPDTDTSDDLVRLRQVGCGDVHSCALDVTGQVWSWGWGEFGQLGLGFSSATYEVGVGGASSRRPTPERIQAHHFEHMRITFVACGGAFSAAVGEAGQIGPGYAGNLFLWGANEVGQCALPPKKPTEVAVPTKVRKLMHTVVRSVACGAAHVVSVDAKGQAYSWGSALYGQLGSSTPPRLFAPPPFELREADGNGGIMTHQPTLIQSVSRLNIMKAACGLHHSLIVSEVDGRGAPPSTSSAPAPSVPQSGAALGGHGPSSGRDQRERWSPQRPTAIAETMPPSPGPKASIANGRSVVTTALGIIEALSSPTPPPREKGGVALTPGSG